jgi:outer membrane receptor for ferrienterochelin and colicins
MKKLICLLIGSIVFSAFCLADVPRFYGEEVVVTALRLPRLSSKVPWDTTVITREDIEESSAVKLGDIIRSVPGISVKANGGLSSQISARLRGSNSQQVLVLLNGNRINSPSLGTFDLGDILLSDVERIEIVKAPLSALYGADAVGGVVNIITLKNSKELNYKLSLSYGEYVTQKIAFTGSGKVFSLSASQISSGGFRPNSGYNADDVNLRVFTSHVEAGVKKYSANKGSPGSLDFLTPQAKQSDNNLFYDVVYKIDDLGFKTSLSYAVLGQTYQNPAFAIVSTHESVTNVLDIQENFANHVVGIEIKNDLSQSTNSGSHVLQNKAVYGQGEYEIFNGNLVLGARQDYTGAYGERFSPRIGFVFNLLRDTLLKTSWGSSFKAPTIDDLYWSRTTEPGWPSGVITTEGNPNLKPETAQSFDITLERNIGRGSTARLSYYASQVRDMIRWTNTSTSTIDAYWAPTNVNNANIQGVEFECEKEINKRVSSFLNFTYQLAKDADSDSFLDYSPQNQLSAGLKFSDPARFDSNVVVKYVGERYTNLSNTTKLPSYTVVDLSVSKKIREWGFKLDVENLFNENYAESYGFSDVYPMPERRYNITVSRTIGG